MGLLSRLRGRSDNDRIPFDMFDLTASRLDREARRARRLESIYHLGQERIWDGREVLAGLIALFHGLCEVLFPWEGHGVKIAAHTRMAHALGVVARTRAGVLEIAEAARADARASVTARAGSPTTTTTGMAEAE